MYTQNAPEVDENPMCAFDEEKHFAGDDDADVVLWFSSTCQTAFLYNSTDYNKDIIPW